MSMITIQRALCATVLTIGLSAPALAQTQAPLTREDAVLVSVTASVQAINLATREVTLKGPLGNMVTFTVDQRVQRLAEVRVGDEVTADYYIAYAAELRAPTDEERATPLTVMDKRARAPQGTDPAGGGLRIIKAVVTVEGLDRPTRSLTIAGPGGNLFTVQAESVENLSKLRLGDTIVITFTEALAVSLDKRAPR